MATFRQLLLFVLYVLTATVLLRFKPFLPHSKLSRLSTLTAPMSTKQNAAAALPRTQAEWRKALEELPSTPEKIPAFFFSHGSPVLAFSPGDMSGGMASLMRSQGPGGSLASFLKDFGSALLAKYRPKGIVVFSAHWDTSGEYLSARCRICLAHLH